MGRPRKPRGEDTPPLFSAGETPPPPRPSSATNERSAGFVIRFRPPDGGGPLYLLLDYGRHWDFPKGHVHPDEDDLAAARRELHEETGISNVRIVPGFRQEIVYFFRHSKRGLIRKTVVFFLADVDRRDVVLSHEHVGYAFLPFNDAVRQVTYATAKDVLRAAHEHVPPPTLAD